MKRKKKEHEEEHVDEAWLLPYSDMLTLLLALFIVMYSMSVVDQQKFMTLSRQFNAIFKGGSGILKENSGKTPIVIDTKGSADKMMKMVNEQDKMAQIKKKLDQEIKSSGYQNKIGIELNAEGLLISIQDSILFNSGQADLLPKFDPVLTKISYMVKNLDNDIRISGHTDNVPIKNSIFRSNWDLSYARAADVMNYMVSVGHINPERFAIQALGEYKPKYDNSTEAGRAKNRSVDILIVRKYHE